MNLVLIASQAPKHRNNITGVLGLDSETHKRFRKVNPRSGTGGRKGLDCIQLERRKKWGENTNFDEFGLVKLKLVYGNREMKEILEKLALSEKGIRVREWELI